MRSSRIVKNRRVLVSYFEKQCNSKNIVDGDIVKSRKDTKNMNLIDRCKLQMSSSMLRLINEQLYSSDTKGISLDRDKFLSYHEAYSKVCDKWPIKPIDYIVKFIKKRLLSSKRPIHKWNFADIGCGVEPLLKQKLPSKVKVHSFDLISSHKDIIEANMDKIPLDDETIHCAVYSLSLMAKNIGAVILECKRVLKLKGSLLIVEVTSRFDGQEKKFINKVERLGFKLKSVNSMKPNGYFTFFHFSKIDEHTDYNNSYLNIELKPCVYKAR